MNRSFRNVAMRTCIGCRKDDNRDGLLRLVLLGDPPKVVPDIKRTSPGRGVSVHAKQRCIESAVRGKNLERAFRCDHISSSSTELIRWASEQYRRRIEGLLMAARRSRRLALGTDAVLESIREQKLELLVVSGDATKSKQELTDKVAELGQKSLVFGTKESNGKLFSRKFISILAILDTGIARQLVNAFECREALAEDS